MTGKISLTASMRSNLLSLQNISRQVSSTQNKLATGNKVNSAIDNPSSYYTARSLTNRANDLDSLLDSMGQAVSTIKTATTALETGATFLEQAAAVVTSALETTKIPDKEWFASQSDVVAVVTSKAELLDALDTKIGNIVIFGQIDMGAASLSLKDGQNLVGVGYFASRNKNTTDSELDKFSALSFDLADSLNTTAITADVGNNTLSDLTINVNFGTREKLTALNLKSAAINNLNLEIQSYGKEDNNRVLSCGIISKENITITGINNFRQIGQPGYFSMLVGNVDAQDADIKILTQGMRAWGVNSGIAGFASSMNLYGTTVCSISSDNVSIENTSINMYENSQIFTNSVYATGKFNLHSPNNRIYVGHKQLYYYSKSDKRNFSPSFSMVEGATITTNTGEYTVPAGGISNKRGTDPKDLTDIGLNKISNIKASETAEYKNIFADFMINKTPKFGSSPDYWSSEQEKMQYNQIIQQYDNVIEDSDYKGINLLKNGNLKVDFNKDSTSFLQVSGWDATSTGLKLSTAQSDSQLSTALDEIRQALLQIRAFTAELGNNYSIITSRQDFTENLINILTEGADKLTLADMNEESANMLALQTRQQLAINSLSLASQAAQAVMKLF